MQGEPTTTVVIGGTGFAGVNTSESRANPSGVLRSVDLARREVVAVQRTVRRREAWGQGR